MSDTVEVVSVNISRETGTIKEPTEQIELNSRGVSGDAHSGAWHRQVSLLSQELIDEFSRTHDRPIQPGEFAENITIRGLDITAVAPLDRFRKGDVELEVTQVGKECHGDTCAIFREVGACVMPKQGLFARVVKGGVLRPGDAMDYSARPLRVHVITLSDRAASGEYEDRSGPEIRKLLGDFFEGKRWHVKLTGTVLPDDPDGFSHELNSAVEKDVDIIFSSGGTGTGPRDFAPDVAAGFCEKLIPGIPDYIRIKFGADKPGALLSRSIAGVRGTAQIYTLPGSVKAVREYVGEITKHIEHLLYTTHGIDRH